MPSSTCCRTASITDRAVFEGERAYGGEIFKSTEHSERLQKSAADPRLRDPLHRGGDRRREAPRAAEERPAGRLSAPGRLARLGDDGRLGSANKIHLAIAAWEWPSYFDPAQKMKGIRIDMAEYRRPDPATAPSAAKAAGLYMICTISKHRGGAEGLCRRADARLAGPCRGMHRRQRVLHPDGVVHTPTADCFLDGITRRTVIDLAKRRGFEVTERRIMPDELSAFNECFITGTAAEVTPVSEIGPYKFQPGNMTKVLMEDYSAEVQPKARQRNASASFTSYRMPGPEPGMTFFGHAP